MRLAVVSPFLDRRHGTERVILEQLERFAADPSLEIHIYAQNIEDLSGVSPYESSEAVESATNVVWHRIPRLPGPHLFGYIWWFLANQFCRWADSRFRGLAYDLVYSPGINCWDADAIAIHIVFHEFYRRLDNRLNLRGAPLATWAVRLHRRLYYRFIMLLERRIYSRVEISLAAVSQLVARHLCEFFRRSDVCVIPNAVDVKRFTPELRLQRRADARKSLQQPMEAFTVLLVGNDWGKKGLDTLLRAIADCRDLPLRLLVVGRDDQNLFIPLIRQLELQDRVAFPGSSNDVIQFYAAADLYASPSLEDSFALPPIEAMACGLPVITSVNNGGSQIITEGTDGFVLSDPRDSVALAKLLRSLYQQPDLCRRIGENAARTAQLYTWERNARETWDFLLSTLQKKLQRTGRNPV